MCGKNIIFSPAFRIESVSYGDGFKQRGFTAAVFACKESHRAVEIQLPDAVECCDFLQVAVVVYPVPVENNALYESVVHRTLPPFSKKHLDTSADTALRLYAIIYLICYHTVPGITRNGGLLEDSGAAGK